MAVKEHSDGNIDGQSFGQTATDKIGFYGKTPIVQRSGGAQATSLVSASAYTSSTHAALLEVMNTLAALGIWKGS